MRLLIVKLSSIGDVVHTLPAAMLLRRSLPEANISWIVDRRCGEILQGSPAVDHLIYFDRSWRRRLFAPATNEAASAAWRSIRSGFDVAIDFQGLIKSGLIAGLSKAPRRIGFETSDLREKPSRFFLTEQISTSGFSHVIDKNLSLARAAIPAGRSTTVDTAVKDPSYEFPIAVSPEDERFAAGILREIGRPFAIINPGAAWQTKIWHSYNYCRISNILWDEYKLPSVVTYGPGEEALASGIVERAQRDYIKPLPCSIRQLFALARRAELFIGSDTGPLHLAAAAGTAIVGLYGPTTPERNGPFDEQDETVGFDLWCRPGCHRRACWHWECMNIPVDTVASAVRRRLGARGSTFEAGGTAVKAGKQG
jgi:lipopolysaccharide heptosyltransferase I